MSERKINLEEVLKIHCNVAEYDKTSIINAMKYACRKTLELAAENAKTVSKKIEYTGVRAGGYYTIDIVDKKSILDTIKQVE